MKNKSIIKSFFNYLTKSFKYQLIMRSNNSLLKSILEFIDFFCTVLEKKSSVLDFKLN